MASAGGGLANKSASAATTAAAPASTDRRRVENRRPLERVSCRWNNAIVEEVVRIAARQRSPRIFADLLVRGSKARMPRNGTRAGLHFHKKRPRLPNNRA
jgi:hypothetical protein